MVITTSVCRFDDSIDYPEAAKSLAAWWLKPVKFTVRYSSINYLFVWYNQSQGSIRIDDRERTLNAEVGLVLNNDYQLPTFCNARPHAFGRSPNDCMSVLPFRSAESRSGHQGRIADHLTRLD
jgi:hypothetical protein